MLESAVFRMAPQKCSTLFSESRDSTLFRQMAGVVIYWPGKSAWQGRQAMRVGIATSGLPEKYFGNCDE
ncbi:hypothetical protein [Janthinobacterium sp. 13]|uniref:hypothetical protein n=1 Tax=Janthinobacterium sp. 13 TaxID=2035211 RepID=UPI00117A98AD|nr:hypothetical protein [Janthinobacterium sp. 13]